MATVAPLYPPTPTLPTMPGARHVPAWFWWLSGVAVLALVVAAAIHASEAEDFIQLTAHARPGWLGFAVLLQIGTYAAQGQVWRVVCAAAGRPLEIYDALVLSLAKLFADQALPSGGVSSTVLISHALEQRGLETSATRAAVLLNLASYHLAYVVAFAAALLILDSEGHATLLAVLLALLFLAFAIALTLGIVFLPGRRQAAPEARMARWRPLRSAAEYVAGAERTLVRNPRLLTITTIFQLAIVLLDATTMWVLMRALGVDPSPIAVFASFMIASLVRTIGIVPGGLGTFEATSVLTLTATGASVATALSATLLFRGLSFWLPMGPGMWASKRAVAAAPRQASSVDGYWSKSPAAAAAQLHSSLEGLSSADAADRLRTFGRNELREREELTRLAVLGRQLRSPLLLLLVFAAGASALTGEWVDAGIVIVIVLASAAVGYSREYSAHAAALALQRRLHARADVVRDGVERTIPLEEVVPGDLVVLNAGSVVPADLLLIDASDCFIGEAMLTGESYPVEKHAGVVDAAAPVHRRTNCAFLGTTVRSGVARGLAISTGRATAFGGIAHTLTLHPPETEFERGIRRFGYLLMTTMLIMVIVVFVTHMLLGRPVAETLLFSVALAVGLSPELLPAVLSINLARDARAMADRGVLVRRLNAIENLGSMDVLCTDKTGTLTEGVVQFDAAYDPDGHPSATVLDLAGLNAALSTGVRGPLDTSLLAARRSDGAPAAKRGEIPFDAVRRRATVLIGAQDGVQLITKGAFSAILDICSAVDGRPLDDAARAELTARYTAWSRDGIRVLAVATRALAGPRRLYARDDERDCTFAGFVTFLDRPKEGVTEAVAALGSLGVSIRLITGDNALVAAHITRLVGIPGDRIVTGEQVARLPDDALARVAATATVFAEVDPVQKERIVLAFKRSGHVVGFLGDGINDVPAMHAADTSLSVDDAVDVARQAADFVLLERGLDVIRRGVEQGRTTFANTLKYILLTMSANLGNMISMAAASLALPFLPLLASQILLNNFLSDVPALGIAGDRVDREMVQRPHRWNVRFIGRYMVRFGLLSSAFDVLTFVLLLLVFRATPPLFRTAWFVESLLTELLVALVVRTVRPVHRSRPGTLLLVSTMALVPLALAIPYLPGAGIFGFTPLPLHVVAAVLLITLAYLAAAEGLKRRLLAAA